MRLSQCSYSSFLLSSNVYFQASDLKFDGFDTKTSELTFYYAGASEMKATDKLDKDMLQKALSGSPIRIQFKAEKGSNSHFFWTMTEKKNDEPAIPM
ncbi:hypothetical protein ANCCAN_11150 [Ancylostoma caninum]|uniref:Uncharacterized protein n=1 Tax=Ancylostoma caninum TaxID=29170 RepID=A0A368GEN8_ANCCA|nr:hypothetical protein ANCCAN_11150 [Ancylostoma caninum]